MWFQKVYDVLGRRAKLSSNFLIFIFGRFDGLHSLVSSFSLSLSVPGGAWLLVGEASLLVGVAWLLAGGAWLLLSVEEEREFSGGTGLVGLTESTGLTSSWLHAKLV